MKFKVNPKGNFTSHFIKCHTFNFCRKNDVIDDVYKYHEHFLELIPDTCPYQFVNIMDLFDWDKTAQGHDFWNALDLSCDYDLGLCMKNYSLPNNFCPNFKF